MTSLLDDAKRMLALQYGDIPRLQHIIETLEKNKMLYVSDRKYLHKLTKDVPEKSQTSTVKYYTEKIKESQGRAQSWEILKLLMSAKCSDSVNNSNDKNENVKLANKFNTHFANVANSRTYDDNVTNMAPVKEANCNPNPLELSLVTEMDVLKEIYALKNKKSAGIDGISSYILKLCAFETVKGITYIINRSIFEGKVPTRWKIAKITPLFKKGDKDNPDHYRPISLLPCVSKLLERVIQRQLIRYLLNNNILSKCQSGFRSKHSTSSALIKVTDEWLMSLDSGMYSGSVFIDLQKAFDLVDLDILLEKMVSILGIKGKSLTWFSSYLFGRHILTSINNTLSSELPMTHGVPQGSILGPTLFLLFINDMPNCLKKCSVHLYADDTVIYYSDKDPNVIETILNAELQQLQNWMCRNKLKINCTKTVSMLMGTKRMLRKHNTLNLKINNNEISQVECFKYLGVYIDSKLKWDVHIDELCKKVGKMISFLGRVSGYVNESCLKLLYNSVIMPHFDYGDVIWHSASKTHLDTLQKLQNRAGRIILKVKSSEHKSINEIHDILNWDGLRDRNAKHTYSLML